MTVPLLRNALVVEDDALQRRLIIATLARLDVVEVHEAADGEEAVRLIEAREDPFDLVLTDLSMPRRDGIELLRDLAARRYVGRIVLLSGFDSRVLETARDLGATHGLRIVGTLEKPVSAESLQDLWRGQRPSGPAKRMVAPPIRQQDLRDAILGQQLSLAYQPKVSVRGTAPLGAECLARWKHPVHGPVPPDQFVALAEQVGLIDPLTKEVFRLAVAQSAEWRRSGFAPVLAVNVSMDNLHDLSLPDHLVGASRAAGLEPADFIIEITESRLMQNARATFDILVRLRLAGFTLSIDDFGTGFSSLEQLRRAPFSEMKIDRSFITSAHADPGRLAILEASLQMAGKLGLSTVAEGVETQTDLDTVSTLGCDLVQGYLFSAPRPAAAFRAWADAWNTKASSPSPTDRPVS